MIVMNGKIKRSLKKEIHAFSCVIYCNNNTAIIIFKYERMGILL